MPPPVRRTERPLVPARKIAFCGVVHGELPDHACGTVHIDVETRAESR